MRLHAGLYLSLTTVFALNFTATPVFADFRDYLQPATIMERIKDDLADHEVGFDVDLLDLDLYEGVSTALKYRYETEPSYIKNYFTRIDRWTLKADVRPGDLIEGVPFYLNISKGTEILFARQFPSRKEAMLALPYALKNLPLTHERALERLNVGDFVSFRSNLSIVVGENILSSQGIVKAGLETHYLVSGEFQIHMFRMSGDRIRMKLIALKQDGTGGSARAGINTDLKIFGIRLLDNYLTRVVEKELFYAGAVKGTNDLFMLDYVFKLGQGSDQPTKESYDRILSSTLKFKSIMIVNPFQTGDTLTKRLIADIDHAEAIFHDERSKPRSERRIDRLFKGRNKAEKNAAGFRFNLLTVFNYANEGIFTQNRITHIDPNEEKSRYLFNYYSNPRRFGILDMKFGGLRISPPFAKSTTENRSMSALFLADEIFNADRFMDLGVYFDRKDKNFTVSSQLDQKQHLKRLLPPNTYARIPWGEWKASRIRKNAFLAHQVVFQQKALDMITSDLQREGRQLKEVIADRFKDYMDSLNTRGVPVPASVPTTDPFHFQNQEWYALTEWEDRYAYDIPRIISALAITFSDRYPNEVRVNTFLNLRHFPLFQEIGTGFVLSLIPDERIPEMVHFSMEWSASDMPDLKYEFGERQNRQLYKSLMYIQSVLNNRSFDMRLQEDEEESGD